MNNEAILLTSFVWTAYFSSSAIELQLYPKTIENTAVSHVAARSVPETWSALRTLELLMDQIR